MDKNTPSNTLEWIFIAKGIGILLVVIGHYNPNGAPAYWNEIVNMIYKFHMPLFFILSGLLFSPIKYSFPQLIINKTKRLLYPFISVAIIFFFIKYYAASYVQLDHPVDTQSIINLIINPVRSYMPLLWFVYTLFFMFLFYPLIYRLVHNNILIIFLFITINSFNSYTLEGINNVIFYFPFFIFGIILREKPNLQLVANKPIIFFILLILFFSLVYIFDSDKSNPYFMDLSLGISGSLIVIGLSKWISIKNQYKFTKSSLSSIGIFSMSIYFFHPLFESFVRIFFSQILQTNLPFELIAMVAILAGVLFPFLAEKYVFHKYNFTKQYLLGLSK